MNIIAIENSRSCNFRCLNCPTSYSANYPAGFMSMKIFSDILANLSPEIFPNCALTGWGEPLLDPTYFKKLALLKKKGYLVGSTTNLSLLNEEILIRLSGEGLDQLNLSWDLFHLEAAGLSLHEAQKRLTVLLDCFLKRELSFRLEINIVVAKKHLTFIKDLIAIFVDYPIWCIGIIPLIMIPSRSLFSQLVTKRELKALKQELSNLYPSLPFQFPYLDPPPVQNCRSDVFSNVYVSFNGEVSPCCVLALNFFSCTFEGVCGEILPLSFGNLAREDFQTIWENPAYKAFRESFLKKTLPPNCHFCNAWRVLP